MTIEEPVVDRDRSHARLGMTTVAASLGFALVQLDVTIVNVALPKIAITLGGGVSALQWVVDAYALSFAALLLSAGSLGDRFGARRLYLIGLAIFALASLGCGLAPNMAALILGRMIQGIGAAAMLPNTLTLINRAAAGDDTARARAVGWWTAAGAITIAAGPILGGLLVETASWRSIFLVNLPLCLIGAALARRVKEGRVGKARGLDVAGQGFAIVALAAVTAAVIEAGLGLGSGLVPGLAVIGLAAACAFVLVERRQSSPMLPLSLFRDRTVSAAVIYGVAVNLTYYGMIFVLTLYLQRVLGYGAMRAGLAYLPLTASFFVVNIFSGWLVGKVGSRLPMTFGAIIDACGFALLLTAGAGSRYWLLLPAFALIPCGMGVGVPAMTTAVLASVDQARTGIASGALNAARQTGGAMGVALFGALAGEQPAHIVRGLHLSAMIAVVMLLLTALLAMLAVAGEKRQGRDASARSETSRRRVRIAWRHE